MLYDQLAAIAGKVADIVEQRGVEKFVSVNRGYGCEKDPDNYLFAIDRISWGLC